jgi:glycosyltransferase involved in cell wall biosynthesis
MQKTSFPFEVIIHDDASTDGTADIIREYEQKYPKIIKPIYQTENQWSKNIRFDCIYIYPRVQGKYFALCEGDDYWIDEYKLQKQVDFLEANEDFSICFHPVKVYNEEEGQFIPNTIVPEVPEVTDIKVLANGNYINTPSVMYRVNKQVFEDFKKFPFLGLGDYLLHMMFAKHGNIKKLPYLMAVYRVHKGGAWELKPIEYKKAVNRKAIILLVYHFIDSQDICDILIDIYMENRENNGNSEFRTRQELLDELNRIYNSKSWRFTKPLREFLKLIKSITKCL